LNARNSKQLNYPSNKPLVSVCIIHRDGPDLLAEVLDSYLNQTYENIEIIVVDDGSRKTESKQYLASLRRNRQSRIPVKVIFQPNRHPGAARNGAQQQSKGEYVLFAEGDDVGMPNEIEKLMSAALFSGAAIVVPGATRSRGGRAGSFQAGSAWLPVAGCSSLSFHNDYLGNAHFLISKKSFNGVGGFSETSIGCEEHEFHARVSLEGLTVRIMPEPLFWCGMTNNAAPKQISALSRQMRVASTYMKYLPSELRPLLLDVTLKDVRYYPLSEFLGYKLLNFSPGLHKIFRYIFRMLKSKNT